MITTNTSTDVFLSHSPRDRGLANLVTQECRDVGLEVFRWDEPEPGSSLSAQVRREIVESSAVLFLVTPSFVESPNLAFEIGLAMAWTKPIYVLYDGLEPSELPAYLSQFRLSPLSELGPTLQDIQNGLEPLTEQQRRILGEAYREVGVPADRLLIEPPAVDELLQRFRDETGLRIGAGKLVQELMRQRKRGELPNIGRSKRDKR